MRHARFLVLALALLLPIGATPLPATAQEGSLTEDEAAELEADMVDVARSARSSTVLIFGIIGLGSGAIVDSSGIVVTNAHVVAGAGHCLVVTAEGQRHVAETLGVDYHRDLAVLRVTGPMAGEFASFDIRTERPDEGDWVAALGFPGGPSGETEPAMAIGQVTDSRATLQNVAGFLSYADAIRTDVPIFSGNSGGPLVDRQGRLVGINGALDLTGPHGFAIAAETVVARRAFLEGGATYLPGGRRVDLDSIPGLSTLLDAFDRRVRGLMERFADGELPLPGEGPQPDLPEFLDGLDDEEEASESMLEILDDITDRYRASSRGRALRAGLRRAGGLVAPGAAGARTVRLLDDEGLPVGFGTALGEVGSPHLAAPWDLRDEAVRAGLPDGRTVRVTPVADAPADGLVLLRVHGDVQLAPLRETEQDLVPGRLVTLASPSGENVSAGCLSSGPRRVTVMPGAGGLGELPLRIAESIVEGLESAADVLPGEMGGDSIEELAEGIRRAIEMRRAMSAGDPRPLAEALRFDAPIMPDELGLPLVDRQGRVVGVSVARSHIGTAYAVPLSRIREAFADQLGGNGGNGGGGGQDGSQPRDY